MANPTALLQCTVISSVRLKTVSTFYLFSIRVTKRRLIITKLVASKSFTATLVGDTMFCIDSYY